MATSTTTKSLVVVLMVVGVVSAKLDIVCRDDDDWNNNICGFWIEKAKYVKIQETHIR